MYIIPKEEMIGCQSWYDLVDYHYTGQDDLPTGVVHCDMGAIPDFFEKISRTNHKYIVISSRSDFGLHCQNNHPPWKDYSKLAEQILGPNNTNNGYSNITLPSTVNLKRCSPEHKYSIKCYRYTEATFDIIPNNVLHWFVCNNTILDDNRITGIPFGFNNVDGNTESKDRISDKISKMNWTEDRPKDLYVNFAFYTNERVKLFQLYNGSSKATVEQNKTFEEYLDQLAIHNLVLCPPGNGWDCYRTLEALYLGCIPVMEYNAATYTYVKLKLPIIILESLEALSAPPVIDYIRTLPLYNRDNWDLSTLTISYWKGIINAKKSSLSKTPVY